MDFIARTTAYRSLFAFQSWLPILVRARTIVAQRPGRNEIRRRNDNEMESTMRRILSTVAALAFAGLAAFVPHHGVAENYSYDNAGRLVKVEYDDGSSVEYSYDAAGNILSVAGAPAGDPEHEFAILRTAAGAASPADGRQIGLLRTSASGAISVETRDMQGGAHVSTVSFLGASFSARMVTSLSDSNGNGADELAVLATSKADGSLIAQVRDSISGQRIANVSFLGPDFSPLDMMRVEDQNGNGADELALLARNTTNGTFLVQMKDSKSAAKLRNINYLGSIYDPLDLVVVPDSDNDGSPELGVLAVHRTLGTFVVQVRNASGAFATRNIFYLGAAFTPIAAIATPDMDGNGVPEIAVLATKAAGGNIVVQARNAFGAPSAKTSFFLDPGYTPVAISAVEDADGNGVPEVALLAVRGDGRFAAQVRNLPAPRFTRTVFFMDAGYDPIGLATVRDIDGNGIDEVAGLGKRQSDGRYRLHIRNSSGSPPGGSNVFFSP
jgi:YD repeat-containing protein